MFSKKIKKTIQSAATALTGPKRREFIAQVTIDYFDGNSRKAENEMGWGRGTIKTGMGELRTGIRCIDHYFDRGRKRMEDQVLGLEEAIHSIVQPHTQADPDFKNPYSYLKITAKSVRDELIKLGYTGDQLPAERTIADILNRMGYSLKSVQKKKPLKKIKETDDIFDNVAEANKNADNSSETLRISLDTKAKVKIGEFSRNGKARAELAPEALDHDYEPESTLTPLGILNLENHCTDMIFGASNETSDFIVDCLEMWWNKYKTIYPHVKELGINLDNGPSVSSKRTQFIYRMTEFSKATGLRIHLIYYPPYHSKYNPIERVWGHLERAWNGQILNSIDKAIKWAANTTWKGIQACAVFLDKTYKKGVTLSKKEMKKCESHIKRSEKLPKWDVKILPQAA